MWQRYVMTETVRLFEYVLMLLFSFLYLKQRHLWELAILQIRSVLVISYRMSYLLVVQMSAIFLPLIAFLPEIRAAVLEAFLRIIEAVWLNSAGLHLAFSILLMFVLYKFVAHAVGFSFLVAHD